MRLIRSKTDWLVGLGVFGVLIAFFYSLYFDFMIFVIYGLALAFVGLLLFLPLRVFIEAVFHKER